MSSGNPDAFKPLAPAMLKTLESAAKQPTNWALVSEAAHAAGCLAKMNPEPTSEFWKTVNEGQLLVNDRFLIQVSAYCLYLSSPKP